MNPFSAASEPRSSGPDWDRLLPEGDHRWMMRLRPGEAAAYFAPRDPTGAVLQERASLLASAPEHYTAWTPSAGPALDDTRALARDLGFSLRESQIPAEAMAELGRTWEPDFVWMHPGEDGIHRVTGGVVCFPSSWSLPDKLGLPMSAVHEPVPDLNAELGRKIDSFLSALKPGAAWTRENVGFSRDDRRNHHLSLPRRRLDETIREDEVWVRVEEQLLRKLAPGGSVLFGIRVDVYPLRMILEDPIGVVRLEQMLASLSPSAADYKGLGTAREALLGIVRR